MGSYEKGVMRRNESIEQALKLPNGARFHRCVLHVNPFEYLARHKTPTRFRDESSYNEAIRGRELVNEILEGGKEAFEMRRLKYGF